MQYRKPIQRAVVFLLVAIYSGAIVRYGQSLQSQSLYSPVAYLILVLSGLWWGRKALWMAGLLACLELSPLLWGAAVPDPWGDAARTVSFFVVAFGLAAVRDRAIEAYRAQRISEEKYRNIVDKSLAGIFVYRNDRFLYGNSRFKDLLGYETEELEGRTFWEFIHPDDRAMVRNRVAERETKGVSDLRYECRLLAKDGRTVWVDIVSSSVAYEGEAAVLVSAYDLTERKEIEQKRKELFSLARRQEEQLVHSTRLAEMGEMAAGIAHELNQPLTGIKNYAQNASYMLEHDREHLDDVEGNLRLISGQVDRASRIIGQMRELARQSERQFEPIDINDKLRETVEFVMPQLRLSGVEVHWALAEDLPPVLGDRIRLEQVFLNLLTNARQAMQDMDKRRLDIRTRREPDAQWPVVIEIADTGKGFSPEVAPKLFAPFFSTKKAGHGTGLGLSISLSIIKDHEGTIEAAGAEGKGAVFTVRLPAYSGEEVNATP